MRVVRGGISIIRVHNGIAQNPGGTYNKTYRNLNFHTDKFSTYAIFYTTSNNGTNKPTIPLTSITGGTAPVSPSVPVAAPTVAKTAAQTEDEVIPDYPYIEKVSLAAEIYENDEANNNIHYILIVIFVTISGISIIAAKKCFRNKNIK